MWRGHSGLSRVCLRALAVAATALLIVVGSFAPMDRPSFRARAASAQHSADSAMRSAQAGKLAASARRTMIVHIYFVAVGDNGKSGRRIGCGDSLVAVEKRIPATRAPLSAAMRLLLSDHRRLYGQSGLFNALYHSRLTLQRAVVKNGWATVHLGGKPYVAGICDVPRIKAQLRQTALQFHTVRGVSIFINNVPLWKRLSVR